MKLCDDIVVGDGFPLTTTWATLDHVVQCPTTTPGLGTIAGNEILRRAARRMAEEPELLALATAAANERATECIEEFATGSQRSKLDGVRYDLVSTEAIHRLAATYDEGARKYSDHNWRKGQPFSAVLNHLLRHIYLWTERDQVSGEDHLAHAAWGLFALMEFEKTHPELDDRYQECC